MMLNDLFYLPGPQFLAVQAGLAAATIFVAHQSIRWSDRSDQENLPPLPEQPDALELAYLRGGANQTIRTILYDLRARGLIEISDDGKLQLFEPASGFDPKLGRVLTVLTRISKAPEVFGALGNDRIFASWMDELRAQLIAQGLYASDAMRDYAQKVFMLGASALIGIASIKITVALSTGHENILFLVLLTAVATFLLWRVTSSFKEAPNARGALYLESLKLAYRGKLDATVAESRASGATHVFDAGSLFLVGLFGFAALSGTAEQQLADMFQKGASGDGGCGGGGGCGGDGGGCGGCGGCGG